MKKIFAVLISLTLLFMSACARTPVPEASSVPLPASFEGDCTVNYQDMVIKVHIQRPDAQICKMSVTAPETLKGAELEYINGNMTFTYGIIKQTLDIKKIPQAAFAPAIINALDEIAAKQAQGVTIPSDSSVYSMDSEYGTFTVTLDESSGAIKSIEMPAYNVKITFDSFQKL